MIKYRIHCANAKAMLNSAVTTKILEFGVFCNHLFS